MKKTLVLGASINPDRYSYKAVVTLLKNNIEVVPVGIKNGNIGDVSIITDYTEKDIDTVTLYLNPELQKQWYDKILSLKPRRIIFNPGTENSEFQQLAEKNGIETEEACTLVLLGSKQY